MSSDQTATYRLKISCNNVDVLDQNVDASFSYKCDSPGFYSAYVTATNNAGSVDSSPVTWVVYTNDYDDDFYGYFWQGGTGLNVVESGANVAITGSGNDICDPQQVWHFVKQADQSYKIISENTGKLIDVENLGTANNTNVSTYFDNGGANQRWYLCTISGAVYIVAAYTDKVLNVMKDGYAPGANIGIYDFNGSGNQRFAIKKMERITVKKSRVPVGGTADMRIYITQANNPNLTFTFELSRNNKQILSKEIDRVYSCPCDQTGYYFAKIIAKNGGIPVDVTSASWVVYDQDIGDDFLATITTKSENINVAEQGANVALISSGNDSSDPQQIWRFVKQNDGSYEIVSQNTEKLIDIENIGTDNNTNVSTYFDNDGPNQRWYLCTVDGATRFIATYTDKALHIAKNSIKPGANIVISDIDFSSSAQEFIINKLDAVHTHDFSVLKHDAEYHWYQCSQCDEISGKEEHQWDDGTVTTEPTQETEGEKAFICTVCGETKVEPIAKLFESTLIIYDLQNSEILSDSAVFVFNVNKDSRKNLTGYKIVFSDVYGQPLENGEFSSDYADSGETDVSVTVDTKMDLPNLALAPGREYKYTFTVFIDGEEVVFESGFLTNARMNDDSVYLLIDIDPSEYLIAYYEGSWVDMSVSLSDPGFADEVTVSVDMKNVVIDRYEKGELFEEMTQIDDNTFRFSGRSSDTPTGEICRFTLKWASLDAHEADFSASLKSYIKNGEENIESIDLKDMPSPMIKVIDTSGDGFGINPSLNAEFVSDTCINVHFKIFDPFNIVFSEIGVRFREADEPEENTLSYICTDWEKNGEVITGTVSVSESGDIAYPVSKSKIYFCEMYAVDKYDTITEHMYFTSSPILPAVELKLASPEHAVHIFYSSEGQIFEPSKIRIDCDLTENPGWSFMSFKLNYSSDSMELVNVIPGALCPDVSYDPEESSICCDLKDDSKTGTMFSLEFDLKEFELGPGQQVTLHWGDVYMYAGVGESRGTFEMSDENIPYPDLNYTVPIAIPDDPGPGDNSVREKTHDKLLAAFRTDGPALAASPVSEVIYIDTNLVYPANFKNKKGIPDATYTLRFADTDDDGEDELIAFALVRGPIESTLWTDKELAKMTFYKLRVTGYDIAEDGNVRSDSFEPKGFNTSRIYEGDGDETLYAAVYDGKVNLLKRSSYDVGEAVGDFLIYEFTNGKFNAVRHENINVSQSKENSKTLSYTHKLFDGDNEYSSSTGTVGDDEIVKWIGRSFAEITDIDLATALYPMDRAGMPAEPSALSQQCDLEFAGLSNQETEETYLSFKDMTESYETYGEKQPELPDPTVELDPQSVKIGYDSFTYVFNIEKDETQKMTGYTLTVNDRNNKELANGTFSANYTDKGEKKITVTIDSKKDMPKLLIEPGKSYHYTFTVTIDGKEYKMMSVFTTNAKPVDPGPGDNNGKDNPSVLYGDITGDGEIDILDVITLRRYLAKWNVKIVDANADVNKDGEIDILDVIKLRRYLANWNVVLGE